MSIVRTYISESARDRAALLSEGQRITSKRTGKNLLCVTKLSAFVGLGNVITRTDFSMYDADKKRFKTYKDTEIEKMLKGVWSIS